jgi:Alcohol dehydrogenase GroES-like domain
VPAPQSWKLRHLRHWFSSINTCRSHGAATVCMRLLRRDAVVSAEAPWTLVADELRQTRPEQVDAPACPDETESQRRDDRGFGLSPAPSVSASPTEMPAWMWMRCLGGARYARAHARAVMHAFTQPLTVEEVRDPELSPDGALIERATGLCRSDWHGWMGHDPAIRLPHVPGHELAGYRPCSRPNRAPTNFPGNQPLSRLEPTASLVDRTQEVGGSSPPSSTREEALHTRGFCRFGDPRESPVIALHFRHQCLKSRR